MSTWVTDRLDSIEVYEAGELDGYVLIERRSRRKLTPVRCCRTCAWADAEHIRYVPGQGLAYFPEEADV